MNLSVVLDWKSFLALGLSGVVLVLVMKTDADQSKEVLIHGIDAIKEVYAEKGVH